MIVTKEPLKCGSFFCQFLANQMSYRTNSDNKFREGTTISARNNPEVAMVIVKYYQRIYYCVVTGDGSKKQHAFFEHELLENL